MLIDYKNINVYQDEQLVLESVNFSVNEGEFIYVTGKVGSGKSSLFKTFYGELPVNGDKKQRKAMAGILSEAIVMDYNMLELKTKHLPGLRRKLGVIFQDFKLLMDRNVNQNLRFVLKATEWKNKNDIAQRISEVLKLVEMEDKGDKMPNELSGGEKQRIAIARAILNKPALILADEPTGNLDPHTSRNITELLQNLSKAGSTVIMITHNLSLLKEFPGRVFRCKDGKFDEITNDPSAISDMAASTSAEEWQEDSTEE